MLMSSRVRRGANSSNIQIRPCSFWSGPKSDTNLGSPTTIFLSKGFVIIQGTTIFTLPDNSALAQVHLKPMDEWRQEVQAALQDWLQW